MCSCYACTQSHIKHAEYCSETFISQSNCWGGVGGWTRQIQQINQGPMAYNDIADFVIQASECMVRLLGLVTALSRILRKSPHRSHSGRTEQQTNSFAVDVYPRTTRHMTHKLAILAHRAINSRRSARRLRKTKAGRLYVQQGQ